MQLTLIVSNLNEEGGGRGGSKPLTLVTVDSRFERFFKSKFTRCARVVSNSGSRYLQSLLTCRGTVDRLKERVIVSAMLGKLDDIPPRFRSLN